ncbi:MAG: DUF1801 domain-containing protein [Armatimonadetes bacterium]|nr:DUF1801 domain-containing protein [Armatimonadota bacterium]
MKEVDEYIAAAPSPAARETLAKLRKLISETAPEAQETMSYRIPTFKFHGFLVSIAAFKNHCSLFPGHTVADFTDRLKGYKLSKGTIQFPHDKPPPDELVKDIVRARMAENLKAKSTSPRS